MPALVVVGIQWGDEGKGKLVDYLTAQADVVTRFQGGNNAGHTLVVDGKKTKLNLIPSGVLRAHVHCLIGAGVVLNPEVVLQEIESLGAAGVEVTPERLTIDRDTQLILGYHTALDQAREEYRGAAKIGTTGRGIGPCYEDRAERCGVRISELANLPVLNEKLREVVELRNRYLEHVLRTERRVSFDEVWASIERIAPKLLPFVGNVSLILDEAIKANRRVVFEGAQGTLLDNTFGTIPFVTSSSTLAGAACTGCGIGPRAIDSVLGVVKAYSTRVGSGPFPTELTDALGDAIREKGAEFGTVTGRPRRCGWFDAVAVKRAVRLNGVDSLAVTKLDVLSGLETIRMCVKYRLDGRELDDLPALMSDFDRLEPVYADFEGWEEDLTGVQKWHHLPSSARLFLGAVAEALGCTVNIVSVGPGRDQTLFSRSASLLKNFAGL